MHITFTAKDGIGELTFSYNIERHTVFVRIEARASISFQRVLTWPLFEPGFYLSPSAITVRLFLCHTKRYMPYKNVSNMVAASRSLRGTVEKESVVIGHHVYKAIWTPVIREELLTRDPAYIRDPASICETPRSDPASI